MRIRPLTSRLSVGLDPPAWRAPLSDLTEVAPGWRRHDRTHLEINLEHPADDHEWIWEAWIFLPQSFRLNADTYSEERICSDFHSQIRFSVPDLALDEIPLAAEELAEALEGGTLPDPAGELKIFACRVREAIARRTFQVRMMGANDGAYASMEVLINQVDAGLAATRTRLVSAADRGDDVTAQTARWADEHLSRVFEAAVIKLASDLEALDPEPPIRKRALDTAIAEAKYRSDTGAGPIASTTSTTRELERVERRQHALKRLTSAVLWLQSYVHDARRGAEHTLHAIAAGIAMAFALAAALAYGTPNDATDLWVWAGLVVIAYMGKDRIKAGLQSVFSRHIGRRYPNRKWTISDHLGERQLANASEKVRFVGIDDLPVDVARFRSDVHRDVLGETTEAESIIHHRKPITVDAEAVRRIDQRYSALTEIFRIDISRWLTNTDDATRSVILADPMLGELFESALPRAYDITIVYRHAPADHEAPWSAARVVVSRKGIRRVDQLDD